MSVGILNLNKPPGMTSRQAVDVVKRLVRPAKVGHAGTLDPLASGVLVVCIGKATRLIEFVQQMPKRYRATFLLGRTSPTEDIEGEVTELVNSPTPNRDTIERACQRFVGTIEQRPPAFSALKVAGRRAYDLARRGMAVELASRPVTIYSLAILDYEYPRLTLDVRCGSGTYIRSLGRDLAEAVNSGAVMSELTRTEIGPFGNNEAIDVRELTRAKLNEAVQPPQNALVGLPHIAISDVELGLISHGRSLCRGIDDLAPASICVALDRDQNMVALLKQAKDGVLWPYINFVGKG